MVGWSQPLTSCVIRFHFINGLMRDRLARARRDAARSGSAGPITVILGGHPLRPR